MGGYTRRPIRAEEWAEEGTTVTVAEPTTADRADTGDDTNDYEAGWWCVNTVPFRCPAPGCEYVAEFLTAAHLILVWPEQDDPRLLRHARRAQEVGRNPRVREYQPDFGPCIAYDLWEARNHPVHAVKGEQPGSQENRPGWW